MTLKMSKTLSNENSINKTSDEWFKPEIDRNVLKELLVRSDFEGWRHIIIYFCFDIINTHFWANPHPGGSPPSPTLVTRQSKTPSFSKRTSRRGGFYELGGPERAAIPAGYGYYDLLSVGMLANILDVYLLHLYLLTQYNPT